MLYAQVDAGSIVTIVGVLPAGAKRLDTGQWITPYNRQWTQAEHEACGWFAVVEVAQPADTQTDTFDRSVTLVAGVPTVTWTQRPKTQAELDAATAQVNQSAIVTNLTQDQAAMQAIIDTSNATINSSPAAAIKNIARNLRRLNRQALNDFTGSG